MELLPKNIIVYIVEKVLEEKKSDKKHEALKQLVILLKINKYWKNLIGHSNLWLIDLSLKYHYDFNYQKLCRCLNENKLYQYYLGGNPYGYAYWNLFNKYRFDIDFEFNIINLINNESDLIRLEYVFVVFGCKNKYDRLLKYFNDIKMLIKKI